MAKLLDCRQEILDSNPYHQIIELSLPPTKWVNINNNTVNEVLEELHTQQGKHIITRNDVRKAKGKHQIVMALMWAFADNPNLAIIRPVLNHLDEIVNILDINGCKNLPQSEYKKLYLALNAIEHIGMTTASVLFFFSQLKSEGNHSVAVTGQIRPHFSDFEELACLVAGTDYFTIIEKINNVARKIDVSTEQLEYFLYRINKGEITIN